MATYIDWVATTFVLKHDRPPRRQRARRPRRERPPQRPAGLGLAFGEEKVLQAEHLVQKLRPLGWPSVV